MLVFKRKTILVVEDEKMVRHLVLSRLKVLGYVAIQASDGKEGIAVFQNRLKEFLEMRATGKLLRKDSWSTAIEVSTCDEKAKILCSTWT